MGPLYSEYQRLQDTGMYYNKSYVQFLEHKLNTRSPVALIKGSEIKSKRYSIGEIAIRLLAEGCEKEGVDLDNYDVQITLVPKE